MIRTKLFPTFGKKMLSEIETRDIIAWQNELLAYRDEKNQPYSPTYLNSIHNQLVAILNHAVRHYRLKSGIQGGVHREQGSGENAVLDEGGIPAVRGGRHG